MDGQSPDPLQSAGAGDHFAQPGKEVADVIDELRLYITGWIHYFGISHTYKVVVELAEWVRRRVRLYYWKQSRATKKPSQA